MRVNIRYKASFSCNHKRTHLFGSCESGLRDDPSKKHGGGLITGNSRLFFPVSMNKVSSGDYDAASHLWKGQNGISFQMEILLRTKSPLSEVICAILDTMASLSVCFFSWCLILNSHWYFVLFLFKYFNKWLKGCRWSRMVGWLMILFPAWVIRFLRIFHENLSSLNIPGCYD